MAEKDGMAGTILNALDVCVKNFNICNYGCTMLLNDKSGCKITGTKNN